MRVVLLILLIALAPLRGMANELMATRMAAALTASMATNAHQGTPAAAPVGGHHCDDMATAAEAASTHPANAPATMASHDGCENCALCQMCAATALPADLQVALPVFGPQMPVPAQADRFASAAAALAQKPPIS
ncbi:MAG: hypothetical protein U5L73_02145 [Rhodoferax sp.]|uniref:hypothetical protein n=1 Tax=Rhodoferax sp. TaxID=50421 RepID=UPI002ACF078D|nr:hypothetical protein [Rhodoferax sp.]MDZ7890542.1 hypothetical protein [Rhodoferax sp.]